MDKSASPDAGRIEDVLEKLIGLNQSCEIIFRGGNGARSTIRDRIGDFYIREGRKWLRTAAGLEIGWDQLLYVNGIQISKDC